MNSPQSSTGNPVLVLATSEGVLQTAMAEVDRANQAASEAKTEAATARLARVAAEAFAAETINVLNAERQSASEAIQRERSNGTDALTKERQASADALRHERSESDRRVEDRERSVHLTTLAVQGVLFGMSAAVYETWAHLGDYSLAHGGSPHVYLAGSNGELCGLIFGTALALGSVFHVTHALVGIRTRKKSN